MYLCDRVSVVYKTLKVRLLRYFVAMLLSFLLGFAVLFGSFGVVSNVVIVILCVLISIIGVLRYVPYAYLIDSYRVAMKSTEFERLPYYKDCSIFGAYAFNMLSSEFGEIEYYSSWYNSRRVVLPIPIVAYGCDWDWE